MLEVCREKKHCSSHLGQAGALAIGAESSLQQAVNVAVNVGYGLPFDKE